MSDFPFGRPVTRGPRFGALAIRRPKSLAVAGDHLYALDFLSWEHDQLAGPRVVRIDLALGEGEVTAAAPGRAQRIVADEAGILWGVTPEEILPLWDAIRQRPPAGVSARPLGPYVWDVRFRFGGCYALQSHDTIKMDVKRYDGGEISARYESRIPVPTGVAVEENGDVLVCGFTLGQSLLSRVGSDGRHLASFVIDDPLKESYYSFDRIALGPNHRIYVSGLYKIFVFAPDLTHLGAVSSPAFTFIRDLVVAGETLYLADRDSERITAIPLTGGGWQPGDYRIRPPEEMPSVGATAQAPPEFGVRDPGKGRSAGPQNIPDI